MTAGDRVTTAELSGDANVEGSTSMTLTQHVDMAVVDAGSTGADAGSGGDAGIMAKNNA